jgi:hypothetical protein
MLVDILVFVMAAVAGLVFLFAAPFLYDFLRLRIGTFKIDPGPISGFARSYSVDPGKPIDLYIHSTTPFVLKTLRLESDWVEVGRDIELPAQLQNRRFNWREGVAWRKSTTLETATLSPGLYRFDLVQRSHDARRFSIPMIVKGPHPRPLCVILATNTWEAYNVFGGISHYENKHIFKLSKVIGEFLQRPKWGPHFVSKLRPNSLFSTEVAMPPFGESYSSFTIRNELEFLVFLHRSGFLFNVYCDDDLASMPELQHAQALIFPGHEEYWTDEMHYALERHMARGGKVYFSNSSLEGHCIAKNNGWEFKARPPEQLSNPISGTHGTQEGVFTAAPYRVLEPNHWIFAGAGLETGDLFGENCLNHPSTDAVGHEHLRHRIDLTGQPRKGASGYFTGKTGSGSGAFTTLAIGTNPLGPAHMVYRDLPGGGWVFNPSSYSFNGALLHDPVIAKIVSNLMIDAAGKVAPRREVTEAITVRGD